MILTKSFSCTVMLILLISVPAFGGGFSPLPGLSRFTPLMRAVSDGKVALVKELINKGADVNEKGGDKTTALMAAVNAGSIEITKYLILKGADPHAISNSNVNAVTIGACGSREILEILLDHNVDPNLQGSQGMFSMGPALSSAIMCNKKENIKVLVKKGKHNRRSLQIALYAAEVYKKNEIISLLIMHKDQRIHSLAKKDGLVKRLFIDPKLDLETLSVNDKAMLNDFTSYELKVVKNSIFARKNYKFNTLWLNEYFSTHFKGYKPGTKKVILSEIDKQNVKFLKRYEKK